MISGMSSFLVCPTKPGYLIDTELLSMKTQDINTENVRQMITRKC